MGVTKKYVGLLSALVLSAESAAHVSVISGPAFADKNNIIVLNVPHGCEGSDTHRVEVTLPTNFTSILPVDSAFWQASVTKDEAGNVTLITWTKDQNHILEADSSLYQLSFRSKLPDSAFTTAYFPTVQYCRSPDGRELTAEWTATGGDHGNHTEGAKPAPSLTIYPTRYKGWNKYTVADHLHDLPKTFADAEIVWAGAAAYSPNPNTMALIDNDASVTALDAIHPGTEIWVKY